jgi:hypothetical protein
MAWLAWRQARAQAAAAACAAAAALALALVAGRADGTARSWLSVLVIAVPGVLGVFCGAPLIAGELESGTFRLAWTQDISRLRWLALRLAVPGLAGTAAAGLVSWIVTWWAGPLDRAGLNQFSSFDSRDIVPVGYAAFAFALGALAGALLRRTVPAMAVTLAAFTAARLAFRLLARPRLLAPLTMTLPLAPSSTGYGSAGFLPLMPAPSLQPAAPDIPGAWITSIAIEDRSGSRLTGTALARTCPGLSHRGAAGAGHGPAPQGVVSALQDCVARVAVSYHEVVTYQPASRYWPLQWYELGAFLAAALLLAAACAWRVRRTG